MSDDYNGFPSGMEPSGHDKAPKRPMDWVPEAAITRMLHESQLLPDRTRAELAVSILEENAPIAAARVAHLVAFGTHEPTVLAAAKFLLEHVAGKPTVKDRVIPPEADPLKELHDAVVVPRGSLTHHIDQPRTPPQES